LRRPRRQERAELLTYGLLALSERSESKGCSPVLLFMLLGVPMAFMFENLQVYQKAVDLADQIAGLTEQFPRGYYFLVDQLNRAALSIATNLAEGNGRFTKPDRRNFFTIARGSTQECVPLLEIARRRGFIADAQHAELRSALEVIAKMTSGLINGLDKREA
jgi:four helix bundle protein